MSKKFETLEINPADVKLGDKVVGALVYGKISVEREVPKPTYLPGTVAVSTYPGKTWDVYMRHHNGRWVSPTDDRAEHGYFTDETIERSLQGPNPGLRIAHLATDEY